VGPNVTIGMAFVRVSDLIEHMRGTCMWLPLKSSHGAPSLLFNYNVVVLNENE
jgi:hypothetical protein